MKVRGKLVVKSFDPQRSSQPSISQSSISQRFVSKPSFDELVDCQLKIYVSRHCSNCDYARQVARDIQANYPVLLVEIIELETAHEQEDMEIPETVFATPTYLLDGRVWSLGNPSPEKILATFGPPQKA